MRSYNFAVIKRYNILKGNSFFSSILNVKPFSEALDMHGFQMRTCREGRLKEMFSLSLDKDFYWFVMISAAKL